MWPIAGNANCVCVSYVGHVYIVPYALEVTRPAIPSGFVLYIGTYMLIIDRAPGFLVTAGL
jgi:hypothetical protein